MEHLLRILLLFPVLHASAYWRPDLPPGPYCGLNNQCCEDRNDKCSHEVLDTLCYCDVFCKRSPRDDCCPDYEAVCMHIEPPPSLTRQPCSHHNVFYEIGDTRNDDCNTCTCVEDPNNQNRGFWRCEEDECLMSDNVVNGVNRARLGWRAHNYTQFQGKKLKDGITYKLGTFKLTPQIMNMVPLSYKEEVYPDNFDSRNEWPGYISPVIDQGWCGSDWAVSIATIVSDRFAIQSNGAEKVLLSPQSLLSCNKGQRGCEGGHIDKAWNYARRVGLEDIKCNPYTANVTRCTFEHFEDGCTPAVRQRRYKVSPTGRLATENDIKSDIMTSGPVQAVMTVYQDFFHYKDGIYRRSPYGNNRFQGLHSVRIVGWGENYDGKFWIVANSWGLEWGEDGYFNIARGNNESDIETFVVTAPADVTEAQRK